jgi:hypothetical protein
MTLKNTRNLIDTIKTIRRTTSISMLYLHDGVITVNIRLQWIARADLGFFKEGDAGVDGTFLSFTHAYEKGT